MSQAAFLRQFDQDAMAGFLAAGLADAGRYWTPAQLAILDEIAGHDPDDPDAPPLPETPVPAAVDVMVDHDARDFGDSFDFVPVSTAHVVVAFQRRQVEPQKHGRVEILDETGAVANTYTLEARLPRSDESLSRWVVLEVAHA